jgi:hypothetical protein
MIWQIFISIPFENWNENRHQRKEDLKDFERSRMMI